MPGSPPRRRDGPPLRPMPGVTHGRPGGPYGMATGAVLTEPGAVLGDPLSVPERPIAAEPEPEDDYTTEEYDTLIPVRLPPELTPYFDLGFMHSREQCPVLVLEVNVPTVTGPSSAFLELCRIIAAVSEQGPCLRQHGARGEVAHHNPAMSQAV